MKLSVERVSSLKILLKELGLDYTDEEVQEAGLAIMRFALVKAQRKFKNNNNDGDNQYGE